VINPIKPDISLWISSEPSTKILQIVWNFADWKLSAVYVSLTNLNVKLCTKLGGQAGGQPEIWGVKNQGYPRPPLEPPLPIFCCNCNAFKLTKHI